MTSRPVLIAAVVILTVFIAAFAIWTLSPSPQTTTPTAPSPTPVKNGTATLDELVLCKDFQKTEGEISCEDALSIAKTKYPGTVREISQENNFRGISSSDQTERNVWRLEIKLNTPVTVTQATFNGMRIFLDRKSGAELSKRYRNIP